MHSVDLHVGIPIKLEADPLTLRIAGTQRNISNLIGLTCRLICVKFQMDTAIYPPLPLFMIYAEAFSLKLVGFLQNATIEYSSESLCVCACIQVCVFRVEEHEI